MNMPLITGALASVLLAACTSVPADRGVQQSRTLLQSRSSVAAEAGFDKPRDINELLSQPLDADAAVRVALNRNASMQAWYAQLGLAQADVYDASRLSNPALGFMRLSGDAGSRTTWNLTQSFTELLFIGYRTRLGRVQVLQAQQHVAHAVLNLEAQVRDAYYQYVSAELIAQLHEQSSLAATAASDYARSLFDAGNISELQLSREQAAASRARIELQSALTRAQQQQAALLTLMGLSLQNAPSFVERLDVPAAKILELQSLQQWAIEQRVDLAMLRAQASLNDSVLTQTRRWSWLSDTTLQLEHERDTDGSVLQGAGGSVGLPIFNQGGGSRLRARAQLESTRAEMQMLQLSINNDVTVQLASLQRARQVVEEYRQRLVPLQERVLELTQQQQNYMLVGAFELLNARREVLQTYQDYLAATGGYWSQYVALSKTVGGCLPDSSGEPNTGISVGVDELPDVPASPIAPTTDLHSEHTGHTDHSEHTAHQHSGDAP